MLAFLKPADPTDTPRNRFAVTPAIEIVVIVGAVAIAIGTYWFIAHRTDAQGLIAPPVIAGLLALNLVPGILLLMLLGRRVAMRRAALHLSGRHDFSAFRSSHCEAKHPLREIRRLEMEYSGASEGMVLIDLEADAFLQHMARIIVGTLAAVGLGALAPDALPGMLASKKRENATVTAPAAGLHLMKVNYDLAEFPELRAFGDH